MNGMQKHELLTAFIKNHQDVIQYIDGLDNIEFAYKRIDKWSAGQQLEHILQTISIFPKILFSKEYILEKFGTINRPTWSYETVLDNYSKTSLKAPERFLPKGEVSMNQKASIISTINETLTQIKQMLEPYTEEEFDTLTLPHPLLGIMTIREMFYLMSYHPLHHQKQIQEQLRDLA